MSLSEQSRYFRYRTIHHYFQANNGWKDSTGIMAGDSENDICIIEKAGVGISFCSNHAELDRVADYIVKESDFNQVVEFIF